MNGFSASDKRGKHQHYKKITYQIKDSVREHFTSIPRIESKYHRTNTHREFIPGDKSLADLYREYEKIQKGKGDTPTNLMMYFSLFLKTNKKFLFFSVKKINEIRVVKKNAPDDAGLKAKFEEHDKEKKLSRVSKDEDKICISPNFVVFTLDLQTLIPCSTHVMGFIYFRMKRRHLFVFMSMEYLPLHLLKYEDLRIR